MVYQYFVIGIILGIAITLYMFGTREEKIHKEIVKNQRLFSTKKLDKSLEKAVNLMEMQIHSLKRELTEDEKDNIIYKCILESKNKELEEKAIEKN